VIVITILAVGALVFTNLTNDIGIDLQDEANDLVASGDLSLENAQVSTSFIAEDLPDYADNYVFWFFVASFIGLLMVGLFLEFEPSVMIIIFIFGSIAVLGAWMGSEVYTEFSEDTNLATTSAQMSKTALLMSSPYFPIFIFIALVGMMVIMYNKKRAGEYQ